MIPVTERMVAAAIIAEAHHPPGADQNAMMRAQMRASLTAALAVAESEDLTDRDKQDLALGRKMRAVIEDAVAARLLDDVTGGAA